jgi:aryl-alcohol dehydrogenase-like predicted oxidoreductase
VAEVLKKIAKRKSGLDTSVALAYVMDKSQYVFVIYGEK